jgi:uncharacterized protein
MQLSQDQLDEIVRTCRAHGAVSVSIFGSFARGEAREGSDLDVLVEFEPGRSLFDLVRLERSLEAFLGRRVDVVTPASLHPAIREHVIAERLQVL